MIRQANQSALVSMTPTLFSQTLLEQILQDKQLENLGDYTTPRGFLAISLLKALK